MSVYDYQPQDARGVEQDLGKYRGKVLLIVNTASKCGLTPQYEGLQKLYETWHDQGLEILGFPCDQFGHQEPGSNDEIQQFCRINYGVTFPVLGKLEVNGAGTHPLYRYLKETLPGPQGGDIQWNFTKFLVAQDGRLVERFEPSVTPDAIEPAIRQLMTP